VCLLPEELQGKIRQNARYILVALANPPQDSLAFSTGSQGRAWLDSLFRAGDSEVIVRLSDEPDSLRRGVGKGFVTDPALDVRMNVRTHMFAPEGIVPSPVFWGYLVRVRSFRIDTPTGTITCEDRPGDEWPASRIEQLAAVRGYVVERIRGSEATDQHMEPTTSD
jgi:hypothetical protein